jgi:hypothetical protein
VSSRFALSLLYCSALFFRMGLSAIGRSGAPSRSQDFIFSFVALAHSGSVTVPGSLPPVREERDTKISTKRGGRRLGKTH